MCMNRISHWIYVGANAYLECSFIPWQNRCVFRRTVDLNSICLQ
ncbi:hypothetical protein AWB78_01314 [Caballeronia calidae]|uniref:Uncharacterized protein n=1 Tax=Caballeronia calidae TaxID=1777139 RepID=A0A158A6Q5_9BURK|nr:hypothetical protein AWB78_01314 [Caballeronia calidae]